MKQKKKITFFYFFLRDGGIEKTIINLANGLSKDREYDVTIFLMSSQGNLHSTVHKGVSVKMHNYNPFSLWQYPFFLVSLCKYLMQKKPDLVITALPAANVLLLIAKFLSRSKAKIIISEHGPSQSWLQKRKNNPLLLFVLNKAIYHLYRHANAIVVVSEYLVSYVRQYSKLPPDSLVHCVRSSVVVSDIAKAKKEKISHRWLKPGQPPVILAVGRLHPVKNFSLLLKAFAKLRQHTNAKLIILGEGSERQALESLASSLGIEKDVDMPGFIKNPFAYMSRAKLFVLSSSYEGMPTVIIEALACGCTVVATNCVSGPSEILNDGKYGVLVPVEDEAALSAAMAESLRNQHRAKLKVNLFHKNKLHMFDSKNSVSSYKTLISFLLNNRQ